MSSYEEKITRHTKREKTKFEKIEQTSELDSDMAGILGLSDQECETMMITLLRALMDKVDSTASKADTGLLPKVIQPCYTSLDTV